MASFDQKLRTLSESVILPTKHPKYSYEGVEIHDITDWLLRRNQS